MSSADQIVRELSAALEVGTSELRRVTGIVLQWQDRCTELEAENERLRAVVFTAHEDNSGLDHVCGCADCVKYRGDA